MIRCGHPVTAGKKFCANCGTPLNAPAPAVSDTPQPPLVCPACSGPLKAGARFCRACGTKIG